MGIDLKKMQAKLDAMQNKGKSTTEEGTKYWKISDGEHSIRIVPTPDGDPFKEAWLHYNVGKGGIMCPKKNYGEDCPICNFTSNLWNEYNKTGDEGTKKLARDMGAKQRFYSPIIVRSEEDKGIQVWSYGKKAYESLLQLVLNPDYGDITDPDEGTDLHLRYGKPNGASFPQTDIMPARKVSKICPDLNSGECKELLDTLPDMDNINERLSTEQVQAKLDEYLSDDDSAEGRSSESLKYGDAATLDAVSSVDEAFSDLMR